MKKMAKYPVASSNQDAVKVVRIENSVDLVHLQVGLISASGSFWH